MSKTEHTTVGTMYGGFSGVRIFDPADLTKEQLLEVLGIGPEHRIVEGIDGPGWIVDWSKVEEILHG